MIQVIVPSYNCAEWIERCMESIAQQEGDFDVVVIDDCSTDPRQAELIVKFCDNHKWNYRINVSNMGAGYNIYHAVHDDLDCGFDDPIVIVDGDDFLPEGVFERVQEIYADPDVWLMWTQYEPRPYHTTNTPGGYQRVDPKKTAATQQPSSFYTPEEASIPRFLRTHTRFNHLITFRSFLFKNAITPQDLQMEDGTWAVAGYDKMIMSPMLEAAGGPHIRFVDEVMYYYNSVNLISDVMVRLPEAKSAQARVARLPSKPRIGDQWVAEQRALCSP